MVQHISFQLKPYPRGFHIITDEVFAQINELPQNGVMHVYIQHTSAGLTINENADPTVRYDFETIFNKMVPEDLPEYQHTIEGPDDMPAHIKAAMVGTTVTIPIVNGRPALGIWQGIFLCEFRNRAGGRKLVISLVS